ncbi:MAG: hotdog domain-containing protein [Gordonia sp. (in: high G+C Gram-positive bacteria)]|uniref:hotdog domain-containing protein n=1 Tax=Gordonia sp. (in: high G+C Gram-positive bacteria) TaxID=84139 RepID=UPI0039E5695F
MTPPVPRDPFAAFAVGRRPGDGPAEMVQQLGPGLTDHRGLIDLPALTVLFDDVGGVPFFRSGTGATIQARLSMSAQGRPRVDEQVLGSAEAALAEGDSGASTVSLRGDRLYCIGIARSVRIGHDPVDLGGLDRLPEPVSPAAAAPVPEHDPSGPGRELVEAIAVGRAPRGALADLFDVRLRLDGDALVTEVDTATWMGNYLGTMHGGVIASTVAQALSFAAETTTRAGVGYQLTEFTIDFLRSPAVDGRTVTVRARPIKTGRRVSVFEAQLYDGDVLLAHATAEAQFESV